MRKKTCSEKKKKLLEALKKNKCQIVKSCREVGLKFFDHKNFISTDSEYRNDYEELKMELNEAREQKFLDHYLEHPENTNAQSLINFFKMQLKEKGYEEKIEIANKNENIIKFKYL